MIIQQTRETEVYVGGTGLVCIKQESYDGENPIVMLHYRHVPELIEHLQVAALRASEFEPEEEES